LTDTDAYFNYLEHQTELRHTETVAQRTKDYKRVSSDVRRSMTLTKIRMIKLQKREEQEAIRAARKEPQDNARRAEEERLEEKEREREPARKQAEILYRKHFDSTHVNWERRGSTVEKKRSKTLFTNVTKHCRDIRTRDERDKERELKALPIQEMTEEQKYKADILRLDSLMYITAEVGDSESASQKKSRRGKIMSRTAVFKKNTVREHFKGLIKLPDTKTPRIVEDLSPDWGEYVFKPVFVELVKRKPRQWWPVVVGDARKGDSELPPPSLTTSIRVNTNKEIGTNVLSKPLLWHCITAVGKR
jgi:hypothetical protein